MRIILLCAVAAASAAIGFLKGQSYTCRIRELMSLRRILRLLKGEIACSRTPLPDALWSVGSRMGERWRNYLRDLSGDLRRGGGRTLGEIFEENTDCHFADSHLTRRDLEQWKECGSCLGYLDQAMQLANLEHYETLLSQKIEELQERLPVRRKLCQSLGIVGGLFLFIVLL